MENVTDFLNIYNYSNYSDYYEYYDAELTPVSVEQMAMIILSDPLNILLLVLCFLGLSINIVSIAATLHIPHGQTAHSKLIINLAISDSCIILSIFLQILEKILSPLHSHEYCIETANQGFLNFALLASLINLLAMAIDQYVAILNPMHYHEIMSRFRGNLMLFLIWIISFVGGLIDFIVGAAIGGENGEDFCLRIYTDKFESQIVLLGLIIPELFVLIFLYSCIFLEVKKLLGRGHALHQDDLHNKKAIITTLLIIGTFMFCWVPNSVYQITMYVMIQTDPERVTREINTYVLIHTILWILMVSNSLCDPIIYALRLREVQRGYNRMLIKVCKMKKSRYERRSRRNRARVFVSDTEFNEQSTAATVNAGNGTTPTTPTKNLELNDLTTMYLNKEEKHLLFETHQSSVAETDNRTLLLGCNTDSGNRHVALICDDEIESELTELSPVSNPYLS